MKPRNWKDIVRAVLPWKVYWQLKRSREELLATTAQGNLTRLAKIYKTDKWGFHFYTPIYEMWLRPMEKEPIRLLEIGVGGYEKNLTGGDSLRMWKAFFPNGHITGIDIYDKSSLQEPRIKIYKGDQTDETFLKEVSAKEGPFNIIIDDGSHVQSHIIKSFETLFPLMPSGGIYVIEDTQTAYKQKYEGSTIDMNTIHSSMNYFIRLVHEVNRSEWIQAEAPTDWPDRNISAIAFYHNLIFIQKR